MVSPGDENSTYFHKFANEIKRRNTIWELNKGEGDIIRGFENVAEEGVIFFKEIYSKLVGNNIVDIVHSYLVFLIWINS